MNYRIKTEDGQIARKIATRPYIAGWIRRDEDGKVIHVRELTTKQKCSIHIAADGWAYERLVPEEIK